MKLHTVSGYKSKQAARICLIGPFGFAAAEKVLRVCVEKSGTTLYLLLLTNVWLSSGQITMSTGNTAVPYVEYVIFFFSVNSCIYRLAFKVPLPSFKSLSRRLQRSQLDKPCFIEPGNRCKNL